MKTDNQIKTTTTDKKAETMTEAVSPGSPRWEELVTQGIIKDSDRNWFLGDAALEINPMGDDGVNNGATANLALYAASLGIEDGTLRVYRQVAANWPPEIRISAASWRVHQFLMSEEDRKVLIEEAAKLGKGERITVTRAHELKGYSTAGRPSIKAEAKTAKDVKDLLTDPVVRSIFEEQPDLIAALPADVVQKFIKSQGADKEQEALFAALQKELADSKEEMAALLEQFNSDPVRELTADRDRAQVRARELEEKLDAALIEHGKLQESTNRRTTLFDEAWEKSRANLKALEEERKELRELAEKRDKQIVELKAAVDPIAEEEAKVWKQYRTISKALTELARNTTALDHLLTLEACEVIGDHKAALIQSMDETMMHMAVIKSKLGADWNASEANH